MINTVTAQWMLELELAWRGGARGTSSGVTDHIINGLNDSYLELIDVQDLLKVHHNTAFIKYNTLVFLCDNLRYLKETIKTRPELTNKKNVFLYWNTGWDNPPIMIRSVKKQVEKIFFDCNIVFLDDNNYLKHLNSETTKFPKNLDILKSNSVAHWSDWLRLSILQEHGGLWIDATAFPTEQLRETINIINSSAAKVWTQRAIGNYQISNWLIYSKEKNNYSISLMLAAINLWLENHESFIEYFHFHTYWYFLSQIDTEFKEQWKNAPKMNSAPTFELWKKSQEVISNEDFNNLFNNTYIHKMNASYKHNNIQPDTVADYLVKLSNQ
ncbi:capsular polysaccharide synthesis protein [Mammaliicoccus sciuri]|uniref:capsular polysaccharide synthesis protein n=2 Tax=Staphylococcaceae TaxID=90964 RepID=UPI00194EB5DA|nr:MULTISPECIES: capsular polysaccharide synthesis protein [Mammaliicoccus]WQK60254.1 capsular polysaccharide synthesis protein [Mammaliicoccus sciuri]WQL32869.1 capsular polysaccharide synthesis protein [Mammaliicoccus sciuri]WQL59807.1 capsular polysaccharide synthesis protein [Mammaliicoccus sciuri]